MRCHRCGARAAYAPQTGGVKVGLCEEHLQVQLAEFPVESIRNELLSP